MHYDKYWMQYSLKLASQAMGIGEIPVGAVICKNNSLLSAAYNRRECDNNSLSHAEILAIEAACKRTGSWRLDDCTLYVTLEPCPMCAGAIMNSRIKRVVFGAFDPKSGCYGSVLSLQDTLFNHKVEVVGGICEDDCSKILKDFFVKIRNAN